MVVSFGEVCRNGNEEGPSRAWRPGVRSLLWHPTCSRSCNRVAAEAGSPTAGGAAEGGPGSAASSVSNGGGGPPSEAERFNAAKTAKDQLARSINAFNTQDPVRAIEGLQRDGLVEPSAAAVGVLRARHGGCAC